MGAKMVVIDGHQYGDSEDFLANDAFSQTDASDDQGHFATGQHADANPYAATSQC